MPMLRVPTAALFERIDERGHDPRTAGTQRVAERDGTAVDICPFWYPFSDTGPGQCQVPRDPADRSITVGVKRYRTKTETHAYLYLSDRSSI